MQRISTTVVVALGGGSEVITSIGQLANVRAYRDDRDVPPLDKAVAAWSLARETRSTYFVHDTDPLAAVADAWARRFDNAAPVGELELAVAETLARWRGGSLELPDYYLVISPDSWQPTIRHFFLGYLSSRAPSRVAVTEPSRVPETIGALHSGKWWPELDELLHGVDLAVPDLVGLSSLATDDGDTRSLELGGVPIVSPPTT